MKRITYISSFARPLSLADIEQIGEVSIRNNKRDGLTGALFCFRNFFYQILEGEPADVDRCYARIGADPRHNRVFVLKSEANISERMYPEWSMKTVVLDENTDSLIRPIKNLLDSLAQTHTVMTQYTSDFVRRSLQTGVNPLDTPFRRVDRVALFADIVGSTTLAESRKSDEFLELLERFYGIVNQSIVRHGGEVLKLTGDGLLASFHREDASGALRAAMESVSALKQVRDTAAPGHILSLLAAGFGMTAGSVLEGNIGSSHRRDFTLIGDVVNTAARLEHISRKLGRAIVFDRAFAAALQGDWPILRLGRYQARGKQQSVEVFTLTGDAYLLPDSSALREDADAASATRSA